MLEHRLLFRGGKQVVVDTCFNLIRDCPCVHREYTACAVEARSPPLVAQKVNAASIPLFSILYTAVL